MKLRTTLIATTLAAAGLVSGAAHAALQGRDLNGSVDSFEAWYDTDLDITATLVDTSAFGVTWAEADTLAANLIVTVGTNVSNNWRLPTAQLDASCLGISGNYYGCAGSELGHLFSIERLVNKGGLWSATESAPDAVWFYNSGSLVQFSMPKSERAFVLAVHSGDIAAVPEADTWAMLLAGLGLVGAAVKRRRG